MPVLPVVKFRQCTYTSRHSIEAAETRAACSAVNVTVPGALGVAAGMTVDNGGRPQHSSTLNEHPATNRIGTWNTVVVPAASGGGFADATADEQSERAAGTVTAAANRAASERRLAPRCTA